MLEWSIIVSSKISTTPVEEFNRNTQFEKLNCTHSQTSLVELVNHFVQKIFFW